MSVYISASVKKLVSQRANGQTIVSGSQDRTVKVWHQGILIHNLTGHQSPVTSVAISSDAQTIVSGSEDNNVKMWRRNGSLIATLTGHQSTVTSVAISANGRTVISAGRDKTVRVWHYDLDYLLAQGCKQLNEYLNTHPEVDRSQLCPK